MIISVLSCSPVRRNGVGLLEPAAGVWGAWLQVVGEALAVHGGLGRGAGGGVGRGRLDDVGAVQVGHAASMARRLLSCNG